MKAGFSRLDITPPLGTPIAGMFYERLAEGILDPLELNAVALNEGENTAIIIVTDATGILEEYTTKIRNMIAEECNVKADHIMITATHSHSSFRLGKRPADSTSTIRNTLDDKDSIYVLLRKYVDAARIAIDDMKEATISYGIEETSEPVSFVRRYLMKDGKVKSIPQRDDYPTIVRPMNDADNFLRLIRIDRKEGKSIALANFSTHACIVAGNKFSPDWPGYLRQYVEAALPDVSCIAFIGAEGDTNHVNPAATNRPERIEHCKQISRVLADATLKAWNNTTPSKSERISSCIRNAYIKTRTDDMEKYDEAKKGLDDYYSNKSSAHVQQMGNWKRIINTRIMPVYQHVPVTTMMIGDILIVGFGGEPFTQYANRSRDLAPDKFVVAAACANGHQGYLPTSQAFADGGYESASSYFSPSIENDIMSTVTEMLEII